MIILENVVKRFARRKVLGQLSLSLKERQTHVILGSSGCGKTTLLRLILGLIEADEGTIHLGDFQVRCATQRQVAKRIGYVIQEGGLFPHLTAGQNVCLVAKQLAWPKEQLEKRLAELTDFNCQRLTREIGIHKSDDQKKHAKANKEEYTLFDSVESLMDNVMEEARQENY